MIPDTLIQTKLNDLSDFSAGSQGNTHIMKNYIVFCKKCGIYVGAKDMGKYYLGARRNHKIIKNG